MAQSVLYTGPNLALRVKYDKTSTEKLIGYATNFNISATTGQKSIHTVDSPMIAELAQGAAPIAVSGSVTLYLPKGSDPIRSGLVPPVIDRGSIGEPANARSRSMHWRIYDRVTQELVFGVDFCKVSGYSMSIQAKGVVQVQIQFTGISPLEGQS